MLNIRKMAEFLVVNSQTAVVGERIRTASGEKWSEAESLEYDAITDQFESAQKELSPADWDRLYEVSLFLSYLTCGEEPPPMAEIIKIANRERQRSAELAARCESA